MSKRPPSRSTRKKDAAVQFLKSLKSKDLRRCSGPCHRSLRSIQGIPQLPLGCKATYAPRPGPSAFRGLQVFGDSLETFAEAL